MQKRKTSRAHKGWKAAARKSRRKPNKIVEALRGAIQAKVRKGHTPWNDPDHDAWVPTDAAPFRPAEAEDFERPWDAIRDGLTTGPELIRAEAGELAPPCRSHSEVVSEMKAQRAAPKGPFAPSPYTKESEDASKMRDRLTECFTLLAKAIEKAAAIVAGNEMPEPEVPVERPDSTWNAVGKGTPLNVWLETKYVSMTMFGIKHRFANICMCRIPAIGDEPEWVEKKTGHTTVTNPDSVQVPTHWRWPVS